MVSVHSRNKMYGPRAIREIHFAFCWENTRKYGKNEGKLWMYTLLRISIRNTGSKCESPFSIDYVPACRV